MDAAAESQASADSACPLSDVGSRRAAMASARVGAAPDAPVGRCPAAGPGWGSRDGDTVAAAAGSTAHRDADAAAESQASADSPCSPSGAGSRAAAIASSSVGDAPGAADRAPGAVSQDQASSRTTCAW